MEQRKPDGFLIVDKVTSLKKALSMLDSVNDLDLTGDQWRKCTCADILCAAVGVPIWDAFSMHHIPSLDEAKELVKAAIGYRETADTELHQPSMLDLLEWLRDGISEAACPERCTVEPDGYCPHGKPSWLLVKGLT